MLRRVTCVRLFIGGHNVFPVLAIRNRTKSNLQVEGEKHHIKALMLVFEAKIKQLEVTIQLP